MAVETFECQETMEETPEQCQEAMALTETLGLTGQKKLHTSEEHDETKARFPYREMLAEEVLVYHTLCPATTPLVDYEASPIPLRVLQVAAHVKSLRPDLTMHVWDREGAIEKDPVLIASTSKHDSQWSSGKRYILARWGSELEAFATLLTRALKIKREQLVQEAEKIAAEITSMTNAELINKGAYSSVRF